MNNLVLVKSEMFNGVQCDIYQDPATKDFSMTRKQIGEALEYASPNDAIKDIHSRHKERLDKFSRIEQIALPLGGSQKTTVYSRRGIYEICRWSQQPKADQFMDFIYDLLEGLYSGQLQIIQPTSPKLNLAEQKQKELEIKAINAEARLNNSKTRQAQFILKEIDKRYKTLSTQSVELLTLNALEIITGENTLPRPQVTSKMYSSTEIAEEMGTTANMVGRIASKHSLRTPEFGMYVLDKKKNSPGQVEVFRFNETGRAQLIKLLRMKLGKENN